MRASSAGHTDTALVLARWSAGWRCEAGAAQAVAVARRAGHSTLAAALERIHPPVKDAVFLRPERYCEELRVILLFGKDIFLTWESETVTSQTNKIGG